MRISAREACVKPHLRTRSDIIVHYSSRDENGRLTSVKFVARGRRDRELSSAGMTARGRRPRDVNRAR